MSDDLAQGRPRLLSLTCDQCHDGWYDWDGDIFEVRQDLQAFAAMNGWIIGSQMSIYYTCGYGQACKVAGHLWGEWIEMEPSPFLADAPATRVRYCKNCTAGDSMPISD